MRNLPEAARRVLGAYEGLRGCHLLPEVENSMVRRRLSEVAGLTHAAELSQVPLLSEELAAQEGRGGRLLLIAGGDLVLSTDLLP